MITWSIRLYVFCFNDFTLVDLRSGAFLASMNEVVLCKQNDM